MDKIVGINRDRLLLNPRLPAEQARQMIHLAEAVLDQFKSHFFLMTSGTTRAGLRWVVLSEEAVLASAHAVNQYLQSDHRDCWVQSLPEFHVGGLGIRTRGMLSGARIEVAPAWDPMTYVRFVEKKGGTLGAEVPTQVYDLVRAGLKCPPSMRAVVVVGGALSETLLQRGQELGWPLLASYGMTETASQIATSAMSSNATSPGEVEGNLKILPHLEVRVNAEGFFQVRGKSLLTTYVYWNETGAPVVEDPKDAEGWFTSQDRGRLSEDASSLVVYGRSADFVKIGGESVELARLRLILDEVKLQVIEDFTSEVELIPMPDERLGHVIALISNAQLAEGEAHQLIEKFNQKVLPFERVRQWRAMDRIPRTVLGKVILRECQ